MFQQNVHLWFPETVFPCRTLRKTIHSGCLIQQNQLDLNFFIFSHLSLLQRVFTRVVNFSISYNKMRPYYTQSQTFLIGVARLTHFVGWGVSIYPYLNSTFFWGGGHLLLFGYRLLLCRITSQELIHKHDFENLFIIVSQSTYDFLQLKRALCLQ